MIALLFLVPAYWPLLLLLPLLFAALVWLERRTATRSDAELGPRHERLAGRRPFTRWRHLAECVAVLALGIALLRPVGVGIEGEDGADAIVVVDVSWSMAARDMAPSRLAVVQQAIAALTEAAPESRFGLVAFAGDASLRVPLTTDGGAVVAMANDLVPGTSARAGTDPGAAIDLALVQLDRTRRGGAILLCTDGEDFAGAGSDAAARARTRGVAVHTFGCGEVTGSKIPVVAGDGETFLRDGSGQEIVTARLDDRLAAIAAAGGGRSVPLTADALRRVHADELLPAARAAAVRAGRLQPEPLQGWLLLVALLLWMLALCLPERVR